MSLKINTLWNLAGSGAPLILGAVTVPYLIAKLGVEAFGILTLIWALIGYFSLFDFGLGRALTQKVAAKSASGQIAQVPDLIKIGLLLIAATGLVGGLLLAALAAPLGHKWLNVTISLQQSTVHSLLIAAIGIPLTTLTTGLRGVLEAYERFKVVNLLRMVLGAATFALPALSVMSFGAVLEFAVGGLIIARVAVLWMHIILVSRNPTINWTRRTRSNLKKSGAGELIKFGTWMTLSNLISPLMVTADRFVISSILGAAFVAYYTVSFEALIRILVIPGSLTAALFPRLSAAMASDVPSARALYKKSLGIVGALMSPLMVLIAIGSYPVLLLWLGEDFAEKSWLITIILTVGILFNSIAQIPHAVIQAAGNVRATALLHLAVAILYVPILIISVKYLGLIGAAITWVARAGVDLLALLLIANKLGCNSLRDSTTQIDGVRSFSPPLAPKSGHPR